MPSTTAFISDTSAVTSAGAAANSCRVYGSVFRGSEHNPKKPRVLDPSCRSQKCETNASEEPHVVDRVTPQQRSAMMSRVRRQHTKPELAVRRLLHSLGYRYRLHAKELKGSPDVVFRRHRAAIFVHGCFWHGHDCPRAKLPQSNAAYWEAKISRNRTRDLAAEDALTSDGWRVLTIWECETRQPDDLAARLTKFLGPSGPALKRGVDQQGCRAPTATVEQNGN